MLRGIDFTNPTQATAWLAAWLNGSQQSLQAARERVCYRYAFGIFVQHGKTAYARATLI